MATVDQMLKEREDMIKVLQYQLKKAQYYMKMHTDQHRFERSFQIGDMVYLKLQPYRQVTVATGISPKFYSPFQVVDKVGKVAYQLALPSEAQIHNIFHISQLKKAFGTSGPMVPLPSFS